MRIRSLRLRLMRAMRSMVWLLLTLGCLSQQGCMCGCPHHDHAAIAAANHVSDSAKLNTTPTDRWDSVKFSRQPTTSAEGLNRSRKGVAQ